MSWSGRLVVCLVLALPFSTLISPSASAWFGKSTCQKVKEQVQANDKIASIIYQSYYAPALTLKKKIDSMHFKGGIADTANYPELFSFFSATAVPWNNFASTILKGYVLMQSHPKCYTDNQNAWIIEQVGLIKQTISAAQNGLSGGFFSQSVSYINGLPKTWTTAWDDVHSIK